MILGHQPVLVFTVGVGVGAYKCRAVQLLV